MAKAKEGYVHLDFMVKKQTKDAFKTLCDSLGISMIQALVNSIEVMNRTQQIPGVVRLDSVEFTRKPLSSSRKA